MLILTLYVRRLELNTYAKEARWVAILMLAAFGLYGGGMALADSAIGGILILVNSFAVVGIGILMKPVLDTRFRHAGQVYLLTRFAEGILLGIGAVTVFLVSSVSNGSPPPSGTGLGGVSSLIDVLRQTNTTLYNVGMLTLGTGSLWFCVSLFRGVLVPRVIAIAGLIGYGSLAVGSVLELIGHQVGTYFSFPGVIFEIAFPLFLLIRGFSLSERTV